MPRSVSVEKWHPNGMRRYPLRSGRTREQREPPSSGSESPKESLDDEVDEFDDPTSACSSYLESEEDESAASAVDSDDVEAVKETALSAQPSLKGAQNPGDKNNAKWERNFDLLRRYNEKHGHCNVTFKESSFLAYWTQRQCVRFSEGLLLEDRRRKLELIGLELLRPKRDQQWQAKFELLKSYRERQGHCFVSLNEDRQLAQWIGEQRSKFRDGKLHESRRRKLESIGFSLVANKKKSDGAKRWAYMFGQLKLYKKRVGNCNVPTGVKRQTKLSNWVRKQRKQKKDGSLPPEREELLKSIGFVFGFVHGCHAYPSAKRDAHYDALFNTRFRHLKRYHDKHGHCNVRPSEDNQLSRWATAQRRALRQGKLSLDRQQKLNSLGFVWITRNKTDTGNPLVAAVAAMRKREALDAKTASENSRALNQSAAPDSPVAGTSHRTPHLTRSGTTHTETQGARNWTRSGKKLSTSPTLAPPNGAKRERPTHPREQRYLTRLAKKHRSQTASIVESQESLLARKTTLPIDVNEVDSRGHPLGTTKTENRQERPATEQSSLHGIGVSIRRESPTRGKTKKTDYTIRSSQELQITQAPKQSAEPLTARNTREETPSFTGAETVPLSHQKHSETALSRAVETEATARRIMMQTQRLTSPPLEFAGGSPSARTREKLRNDGEVTVRAAAGNMTSRTKSVHQACAKEQRDRATIPGTAISPARPRGAAKVTSGTQEEVSEVTCGFVSEVERCGEASFGEAKRSNRGTMEMIKTKSRGPRATSPRDLKPAPKRSYLNQQIASCSSSDEPYFGTVISYHEVGDETFWTVRYETGHTEEFSRERLDRHMKLLNDLVGVSVRYQMEISCMRKRKHS